MKFSSTLGFFAGLAGLTLTAAAPLTSGSGKGVAVAPRDETVTIEAATIFLEESSNNYYITFEEVVLVEVIEESSGSGHGHSGHSGYSSKRSSEWDTSASHYGSHVTIEEEIVLVEVITQKRYKTVTTIEVAEYIRESSSKARDVAVAPRDSYKWDHSSKNSFELEAEIIIEINDNHYRVIEAIEIEVYFQEGHSYKTRAVEAPRSNKGSDKCHSGKSETITIAAEEVIIVNDEAYQTVVAIEVVVEILEEGCY